MFQSYDQGSPVQVADRQAWLALLARAPLDMLRSALEAHPGTLHWLRKPETGLLMVQGRAGGTGERFNVGEVTMTRCALRADESPQSPVGVAYVLGRNHHHAQWAALADALLQDPQHRQALEKSLLEPVREYLKHQQAQRHHQSQTTKVDFMTVAREAGLDTEGNAS